MLMLYFQSRFMWIKSDVWSPAPGAISQDDSGPLA